jgi:hypothetical protein
MLPPSLGAEVLVSAELAANNVSSSAAILPCQQVHSYPYLPDTHAILAELQQQDCGLQLTAATLGQQQQGYQLTL